jgi:hypothetical protein
MQNGKGDRFIPESGGEYFLESGNKTDRVRSGNPEP